MSAWFLTRVKTVIHVSVVCFSLLCLLPALSVAAQVTMEWDLNDPTPEGYRIYQRTEGQDYDYNQPVWTGTENTCTINGLDDYINYCFVVRAYTGSNESTDSNEITFLSSPHQDTTYTISVLAGDNGSILPSNTVAVNSGDDKTFTISAETGYDVSKVIVDGANVGTVSSYTFGQVAANHTISAVFSINSYTIAASTGTNGSIFPVGNVSVAYGGEQAFTITPDDGYHVSDVKVDGKSKGPLSTFTFSQVAANRSIAVSFSKDTFTIPDTAEVTLKWDPTNPAPDNYAIYQRAEEQTYDYSQPCWTGTGTSGIVYNLDFDTTYYFVVRAQVGALQSTDSNEITYRAASTPTATYTISASAGANGSVTPSGSISVEHGDGKAYAVIADVGHHVSDVKVDGVSIGAVTAYTFANVTADHTINATFATDTYTISASADANGSVTPSGSISVEHGDGKAYAVIADVGHHVSDVKVDGVSIGAVTAYTFANVTADHTINATFATDTYTISASAGANGSVTPSGSISVEHGDGKAYAVIADVGHHVSDVKVDGVSIGAVTAYTFANVTADHTINATFATDTYTISASAGANGSVTPTGVVDIAHGGNQVYIFKADQGFHVEDVQVDGKSIGAVGNYTFTDIIDDHTLLVSFSENTLFKIWIEAEDGDLQWPMEIADDESASTGGYVWVSEGTGNFAVPSETAGSAEYHFEVSESGDYAIWGRQISANTSSDSFFVSIDGLTEIVWHTKPGGPENWTWDVVSIRNAEDPDYGATPETFKLMPGSHTLKIRQREDGTKLDRILITNQTDLTDPEPNTVMDTMVFGDVQMDHNWVRIDFEKPFVNPVVVAGPISLNGGHPAVVRIRNVDPTGFEMRIQEWGYLDGSHMTETVSYIVVEEGNYTLDDGTKIAAAVLDTSAVAAFQQIIFDEQFNVAPVVMTTLTSFNESDAVTGRLKQITTDSFSYRMQEQELNANTHVTERLDYIAWEPSSGERGGITYRVGHSADAVKHKNYTISFDKPFASSPALLAGMQTTDGGDTANVRYSSKDGVSVDVLVDEEQSRDTETNHTTEIVGYMAFTR